MPMMVVIVMVVMILSSECLGLISISSADSEQLCVVGALVLISRVKKLNYP